MILGNWGQTEKFGSTRGLFCKNIKDSTSRSFKWHKVVETISKDSSTFFLIDKIGSEILKRLRDFAPIHCICELVRKIWKNNDAPLMFIIAMAEILWE